MKSITITNLTPENPSVDCDAGHFSCKLGVRHLLAVMVFLGFFNDYTLRTNLSIALVAMVNNTDMNPKVLQNSTKCTDVIIQEEETANQTGEFNWDHKTRGIILGSFFYGYVISQIPGGYLSRRFGSKRLFGYGILIAAIASLFTPLAARWNVYALIALRVFEGIGEGVTSPSIHNLWGNWAPKLERSQLVAFSYAGIHFGSFISIPVSGILINNGVFGGWPSVFYIFGTIGCIWWAFWMFIASDSPSKHWFISNREKEYIENSIEVKNEKVIPWLSIIKSKPLWAICVAHFSNDWAFTTILTSLPMYMNDVLHFNIQKNALMSGLPYIALWFVSIAGGYIADFLREKNYLSTGNTRKLMNTLGFILPSIFLVTINYICCNKVLAVTMIFLAIGTNGFGFSGFLVNHLDLAPPFAGILFSITNIWATISGMVTPYVVGIIIAEQNTSEEWKVIFFISVAIYLFGCVIYLIFASGDVQPWAYGCVRRKSKANSFDFDTISSGKL